MFYSMDKYDSGSEKVLVFVPRSDFEAIPPRGSTQSLVLCPQVFQGWISTRINYFIWEVLHLLSSTLAQRCMHTSFTSKCLSKLLSRSTKNNCSVNESLASFQDHRCAGSLSPLQSFLISRYCLGSLSAWHRTEPHWQNSFSLIYYIWLI